MKTNHSKRIVFCLLAYSLLLIKSAQAQTADKSAETASSLDASIYPIAGSSPAIKINFNNATGGAVRLVIKNQDGTTLYDEREYTTYYRRRFNLAELPAGHYKVELSKGDKRHMQTFVIEPQVDRHVALENMSVPSQDKKLAANQ